MRTLFLDVCRSWARVSACFRKFDKALPDFWISGHELGRNCVQNAVIPDEGNWLRLAGARRRQSPIYIAAPQRPSIRGMGMSLSNPIFLAKLPHPATAPGKSRPFSMRATILASSGNLRRALKFFLRIRVYGLSSRFSALFIPNGRYGDQEQAGIPGPSQRDRDLLDLHYSIHRRFSSEHERPPPFARRPPDRIAGFRPGEDARFKSPAIEPRPLRSASSRHGLRAHRCGHHRPGAPPNGRTEHPGYFALYPCGSVGGY